MYAHTHAMYILCYISYIATSAEEMMLLDPDIIIYESISG